MSFAPLQAWKWAVLGLTVGLLYGGMRRWAGPTYDASGVDTLDAGGFERLASERGEYRDDPLLRQYHVGLPVVRALVVHPRTADDPTGCWVSGEQYKIVRRRVEAGDLASPLVPYEVWLPFKYRAPQPYRAMLGAPGTYASVADYLAAMRGGGNPHLAFQFAWWEQPPVDLLLPAAVGLICVGVAWPLALRLVTGGHPAKEQRLRLSPPAKAAVELPAAGVRALAAEQLRDFNDELETELDEVLSRGCAPSEKALPPACATVASLLPAEHSLPEPAKQSPVPDEYGGEFYPVARPAAGRHPLPEPEAGTKA